MSKEEEELLAIKKLIYYMQESLNVTVHSLETLSEYIQDKLNKY